MKLISVQSRGDRLAKIYFARRNYYMNGIIITNPFNDNNGWLSRVYLQKTISKSDALKAAETWLEGASNGNS